MDIVKNLSRKPIENGNIVRIIKTDDNHKDFINKIVITRTTSAKGKNSACSKEERRYCDKVNKNNCIEFCDIEDLNNKVFSCYCEVELLWKAPK